VAGSQLIRPGAVRALSDEGLRTKFAGQSKSEDRPPMFNECKTHFGLKVDDRYVKNYLLPGHTDILGVFSEKNGSLECFEFLKIFYPVLQECSEGDVGLANRGTIYMESIEVSYDNCIRLITHMMQGVSNVQTKYYNYFDFEGFEEFKLCFTAEVRSLKYFRNCPIRYKNYRIDVRNFWFRKASKGIRNRPFFRSPNVQQYEYLMAANFSTFNDDYDYDSHENEYSDYVEKEFIVT